VTESRWAFGRLVVVKSVTLPEFVVWGTSSLQSCVLRLDLNRAARVSFGLHVGLWM
jgi:hypothetical protein